MHILGNYYFIDGWYIFSDGKGNNSVVSYEHCKNVELEANLYQASQDINRGGREPEDAYRSRGIKRKCTMTDIAHLSIPKYEYSLERYQADRVNAAERKELKGCLVIPERIGEFQITCVANNAFRECKEITEVILPKSVTWIGQRAFMDCSELTKIEIPYKKIDIGKDAFTGTKYAEKGTDSASEKIINNTLMSVDKSVKGEYFVPKGIEIIAESAFEGCNGITNINVPDSVKEIGNSAFYNCTALESIRLPQKVNRFGYNVFSGCSNLKNIVIPAGVTELRDFRGCTNLRKVVLPKSIHKIWDDTFKDTGIMKDFLESEMEYLVINDWLIHYKVPESGKVIIPDGVRGIADQNSFSRSWYQKPYGDYKKVVEVKLPDTLEIIGRAAFYYTGIKNIHLPNKVKCIEDEAFRYSDIEEITIPKSVKNIEQWSFMDCYKIKKINFLGDTEIKDFAITGRKDNGQIMVTGLANSYAQSYCAKRGEKYNLYFVRK